MSKFKIGDRVEFVGVGGVPRRGAVAEVRPDKGDIVISVDPGQGYVADLVARLEYQADLIAGAALRGPKPLTLTGGKARFTVRSGATTRAPRALRARWRMADDRFPARLPLPAPWVPAAND